MLVVLGSAFPRAPAGFRCPGVPPTPGQHPATAWTRGRGAVRWGCSLCCTHAGCASV